MPTRSAHAVWNGTLTEGSGQLSTASKAINTTYTWKARAEDVPGTNPEELLAAAHAGCFSMALSHILTGAGFPPKRISTTARVSFEKQGEGFAVTRIALSCRAEVPGIDAATFRRHAEAAKTGCPISKALSATPIDLDASLG
jgi:osmotically inducible protein OsmC